MTTILKAPESLREILSTGSLLSEYLRGGATSLNASGLMPVLSGGSGAAGAAAGAAAAVEEKLAGYKTKQEAVDTMDGIAAGDFAPIVIKSFKQNANGEIYDVVTSSMIPSDIGAQPAGNYKVIQEAKNGTLTGAQVVNTWSQDTNGVMSITTRNMTPGDIGAQPAGNYKTKQAEKADAYANGQVVTSVSQNANGEITVAKTDVAKALEDSSNIQYLIFDCGSATEVI
jgi:hypothetical protein